MLGHRRCVLVNRTKDITVESVVDLEPNQCDPGRHQQSRWNRQVIEFIEFFPRWIKFIQRGKNSINSNSPTFPQIIQLYPQFYAFPLSWRYSFEQVLKLMRAKDGKTTKPSGREVFLFLNSPAGQENSRHNARLGTVKRYVSSFSIMFKLHILRIRR